MKGEKGDHLKIDKPDNGVGRLIMSFACGFDTSKSPFALIGMPKEGKVADTSTRCHHCIQPIVEPVKPLRCCGNVVYCNEECKQKDIEAHNCTIGDTREGDRRIRRRLNDGND